MVDGHGQAGLAVSVEECVFGTKAGSNSCKSEPTLNSANPSPQCPHCLSKKSGATVYAIKCSATKSNDGSAEIVD